MSIQERVAVRLPVCRQSLQRQLCLLLVLLLVAGTCAARSGEIVATGIRSTSSGGVQLLDAQFSIRLSKGAREALENGVPLSLEFQVQLVREHDWLWDSVENEHVLVRQLQYYALTRSYQLHDSSGNTLGVYSSLEDVLAAAGTIERLLLSGIPLDDDRDYSVRLRGSIDIEALPTPVRLLAYVSSDWDMKSEWYAWPLEQ